MTCLPNTANRKWRRSSGTAESCCQAEVPTRLTPDSSTCHPVDNARQRESATRLHTFRNSSRSCLAAESAPTRPDSTTYRRAGLVAVIHSRDKSSRGVWSHTLIVGSKHLQIARATRLQIARAATFGHEQQRG